MADEAPISIEKIPEKKTEDSKVGKLKLAFLYILIGGLVISALISVVAILIGEFNTVVQKALLTTFIFVAHSLFALAIVLADKNDRIGKSLISTTILAAVILNMLTLTIGTWDLWSNDYSWKAFFIYMLAIGSSFLLAATLKLRLAHTATNIAVYTTFGLILFLTLLIVPWLVVPGADVLNGLYFRSIGATAILATTALSLSIIINRIAIGKNPELKKTRPTNPPVATGILAIYITIGIIVACYWIYGLTTLVFDAALLDKPAPAPTETFYEDYDYDTYND